MKINTKKHNFEDMYKVGNVIQWINGNIYLVVDHGELDYSLVDLTNNKVYATYDTLENLISDLASDSDVLLNAEINVFWGEINMKINFKNSEFEDIYKVGNVIKGRDGFIYLIVKEELGYTVVDLSNDAIYEDYDTMQDLIDDFATEGQSLVNAEINIF